MILKGHSLKLSTAIVHIEDMCFVSFIICRSFVYHARCFVALFRADLKYNVAVSCEDHEQKQIYRVLDHSISFVSFIT